MSVIRKASHLLLAALLLAASTNPGLAAGAKAAAKPTVSPADIDLWAFSVLHALAPGKTLAEFRALPKLSDEKTEDLHAEDAPTQSQAPHSVRLNFADGMRLRVIDYGEQAFISHLRVDGAEHPLLDALKIGATRAQVEAVLGRPSRGGISYTVYDGKDDTVRFFYAPDGKLSAVEIDTGG